MTGIARVSDTLERISAALGIPVDAIINNTGEAAYFRQCSELMDLFSKLPDEQTREACLGFVRSLLSTVGLG